VTAIVTGADPTVDVPALAALLEWLPAAGVPRGRAMVLLAAGPDGRPAGARAVRDARAALGVPVIAHDPARAACFGAGLTPAGLRVEVCDELREAEAVVAAGRLARRASPAALDALVVPGLAAVATRGAVAAAPQERAAAAACVPLDLALGWRARPGGGWEALAACRGAAP
jgi:hypothetical protein